MRAVIARRARAISTAENTAKCTRRAPPRDSPRSRPDWDDPARMSLRARLEQVFGLTRRSRARVSRARGLLSAASRSECVASVLGWRGSFLEYRCGAAPESHRLPSWDARHKACDARTRATGTVGEARRAGQVCGGEWGERESGRAGRPFTLRPDRRLPACSPTNHALNSRHGVEDRVAPCTVAEPAVHTSQWTG